MGADISVSFSPKGAVLRDKAHENKLGGLQTKLTPAGPLALVLCSSHLETQRLPLAPSQVFGWEGLEPRCAFIAKDTSRMSTLQFWGETVSQVQ